MYRTPVIIGEIRINNYRKLKYHPTADANGRSRVVGVSVYADWNAPFLFFVAFLAELY